MSRLEMMILAFILSLFFGTALAIPHTNPINKNNTFIYNPKTLTWHAYDANGALVKSGHGSAGQKYCKDIHRGCKTPVGQFSVYSKGSASCKSSKYPIGRPGAPMPWCMFFHGGFAIHGSNNVPNHNASHGCIRVRPSDAHWLSRNFIRIGTVVIVKPYL